MTKQQFIKQFKTLTKAEQEQVEQFHNDKLKNAIFVETFETAERALLWIREAKEQ